MPISQKLALSNMKILTDNWEDNEEDELFKQFAFETFNKVEESKSNEHSLKHN